MLVQVRLNDQLDLIRRFDEFCQSSFRFQAQSPEASGALVKGDVYRPSQTGSILYFDVEDIDEVLRLFQAKGAKVLYPKKDIGSAGFVAEIEDTEGNRIALSATKV